MKSPTTTALINPPEDLVNMIHTHADEIPKDLDADATMNLILYKYLHLYDGWSEERQEGQAQLAELKSLVKTFDNEVKAFASFKNKMHQDSLATLNKSVANAVHAVSGQVLEETTQGAKEVTSQLDRAVYHATQELESYKSYLSSQHLKTIGITIGTLVLVGVIALKFLMPSPLTDDQIKYIAFGQKNMPTWNSLSYSEQESINKIINNHTNG